MNSNIFEIWNTRHPFLRTSLLSSEAQKPTSAASAYSPPVTIRHIDDKSHPANGQMGLFASKKIQPNSHIIDYMGEVHSDDRPESDYDLSLYRSPDGSVSIGVSSAVTLFQPPTVS